MLALLRLDVRAFAIAAVVPLRLQQSLFSFLLFLIKFRSRTPFCFGCLLSVLRALVTSRLYALFFGLYRRKKNKVSSSLSSSGMLCRFFLFATYSVYPLLHFSLLPAAAAVWICIPIFSAIHSATLFVSTAFSNATFAERVRVEGTWTRRYQGPPSNDPENECLLGISIASLRGRWGDGEGGCGGRQRKIASPKIYRICSKH